MWDMKKNENFITSLHQSLLTKSIKISELQNDKHVIFWLILNDFIKSNLFVSKLKICWQNKFVILKVEHFVLELFIVDSCQSIDKADILGARWIVLAKHRLINLQFLTN